jgi:hypothetical protein
MVGVGAGRTSPARPKNLWAGILLEKCNYMKGRAEIRILERSDQRIVI